MVEKLYRFTVTDAKLQEYIDTQPNIMEFVRTLIKDYKDGKLVYLAESIDAKIKERRYEKLLREITKLDIDNKIRLIRELHVAPLEAAEIASGQKELEPSEIADSNAPKNLTESQWNWIYGTLSDGYGKLGMRKCIICNEFGCEKDETMRKHIIDNHQPQIQKAIQDLKRFGIKVGVANGIL